MLRFFACAEDLSHEPPDAPLPDAVASGSGAIFVARATTGGQAGWNEQPVPRADVQRLRRYV
jgi:hypothetical protein